MVITGLTRNQLAGNRTWVQIPPSPPNNEPTPVGVGLLYSLKFSTAFGATVAFRVVYEMASSVPPNFGITAKAAHHVAVLHCNAFFGGGGAGFDAVAGVALIDKLGVIFPLFTMVHTAIYCVEQFVDNGIFHELVIHIVLQ